VDKNPDKIGFSINDVDKITGEVLKTIFHRTFDLSYYTNQKNLSHEDRDKLKFEMTQIYKYIFDACEHYKVAYFSCEELTNITNSINSFCKTFNRKTHNVWYRELQLSLIKIGCGERGIIFNEVAPMYSSFIGNIKHNLFDPEAASVELSRRGYLKYKKEQGNRMYPSIDKEDYEKMSYLVGQDVSKLKTWVALYKKFNSCVVPNLGVVWRNKNPKDVGKYLFSKKSNVIVF
jgi:IS605 OrfB family transposase